MKGINCRVMAVTGKVMNVCNLGKGELDELVMTMCYGEKDKRLYSKRNEGGRGLKTFKEVYDETKTRVAYYMATATNEWTRAAWRNESQKE